ncbi:MAG: hypothetical protein HY209_05835, partial [Candidatus Omnitrophica bacterium]|nr:hypothetical protein [Candidatus Omnitrophota bacterium]
MYKKTSILILGFSLMCCVQAWAAIFGGGSGSGWDGDNGSIQSSTPPNKLAFTTFPSGTLYPGTQFNITTTVEDINGSANSSTQAYNLPIALSATDSGAVTIFDTNNLSLPADTSTSSASVTYSNGAVNYTNIYIEKQGSFTLSATETSGNHYLASATQLNFTIQNPIAITPPPAGFFVSGINDPTQGITWSDCRNDASTCPNTMPCGVGGSTCSVQAHPYTYVVSSQGSSNNVNAAGVTGGTPFYAWAPPYAASTYNITLKVADTGSGDQSTYQATSNSIPVYTPSLNISDPSPTTFNAGSTFSLNVTVKYNNGSNPLPTATGAQDSITLQLCDSKGQNCGSTSFSGPTTPIAMNASAGVASFTGLSITNPGSFKICAADGNTSIAAACTSPLTVISHFSNVSVPSTIYVGDSATITWKSDATVSGTKLKLFTNGTLINSPIATGITSTSSSTYSWTATDNIASTAYIQVCQSDDTQCVQSNTFKILPKITMSSPTSSTSWVALDPAQNITWTYTGTVNSWQLAYATSTNGGNTWSVFTTFTPSASPTCSSNSCTLNWSNVPDIIHAVFSGNEQKYNNIKVKIQIADGQHTSFNPLVSQASSGFIVKYYPITWKVLDPTGSGITSGLGVLESPGSWIVDPEIPNNGLSSGFVRYYPYSLGYQTTWRTTTSSQYNGNTYPTSGTWNADSDNKTNTVTLYPKSATFIPYSNFTYDSSANNNSGAATINCWLQSSTGLNKVTDYIAGDACTVTIKNAINSSSDQILTSSSPNSDGVFTINWDLSNVNKNSTYYALTRITHNSTSFYSNTSYDLAGPSILNSVQGVAGVNWTQVGNLGSAVDQINTKVATISDQASANQNQTIGALNTVDTHVQTVGSNVDSLT